jgi:tetratricopeptide (TPR) repeat protein
VEDDTTRPEPDGIDAQGPKKEATPDPVDAVKRLSELEEEIKQIREKLSNEADKAEPEPSVESIPDAHEPEPSIEQPVEPVVLSEADYEQVESLIRQARVARNRQQIPQAIEYLNRAIEIDPSSSSAIVELGDIYLTKNRWSDAKALFFRASKISPNNISIERKYAEAVLKSSVPVDALLSGSNSLEQAANAKSAAIISFIFPGVGQIVLGQTIKGVTILCLWILSLVITFAIPNGIKGLLVLSATSSSVKPDYTVLLPISFALILCIYATYDALSQGRNMKHEKRDRPKPPVDLPY